MTTIDLDNRAGNQAFIHETSVDNPLTSANRLSVSFPTLDAWT